MHGMNPNPELIFDGLNNNNLDSEIAATRSMGKVEILRKVDSLLTERDKLEDRMSNMESENLFLKQALSELKNECGK